MYLWQIIAVSTVCQKLSTESTGKFFFVCFKIYVDTINVLLPLVNKML